jgi:hypothetical protein
MKKLTHAVLALLIILPAFLPWMPHTAAKALHIQQEAHHQNKNTIHAHGHNHHAAPADHGSEQSVSHGFHADIITYFNDYLHVDLQNPDQVVLKAPTPDTYDIEFTVAAAIEPQNRYELASVQSRAPPDWRTLRPENTPLYLSTLRLRI